MPGFPVALRAVSIVFFVVAALHLSLGLAADVLLGARVPADVISDAALDSQNRFYGTTFALYGLVFFIGAGDINRYRPLLLGAIWCFFAGGLARLVSIAVHGWPPLPIIALLVTELVLPPAFQWWLSRRGRGQGS